MIMHCGSSSFLQFWPVLLPCWNSNKVHNPFQLAAQLPATLAQSAALPQASHQAPPLALQIPVAALCPVSQWILKLPLFLNHQNLCLLMIYELVLQIIVPEANYHTKISALEDMIDNSNSRNFWNCLKSMDDSMKETSTSPISEESWLSHFQSLHSNEPLNSHQEAIIDELTRLEDATTQSHALDYLITELEIRTADNKLKNNKSSYSDRIKN